jgi:RNA polymerase sigma-70 factor (ECF subfamily)
VKVAYPINTALAICPEPTISLQAARILSELVYAVTEPLFSSANSRNSSTTPLAVDLEDIRQSRNGDSEAYRRLIERYQRHIGQILWRFSRDHRIHEELVQDVFVQAYISLARYRGKAPFAHWLSRIATRVGYRYWKQVARRSKRKNFSLKEWDQLPGDSVEKRMAPSQAAALLHRLLGQLPPRDRLVLTLRYLEECDVAQTAQRTGWTKSMVKVQTWRARNKLRNLFNKSGREIK